MTDEINPSELGAYTNNLPNKEGIKKLCNMVNEGGGGGTTYTAGDNIQISAENVISATDTTYTAGDNVQISEQNVISATDTKYTAGTNVAISDQNVISATDTTYTAGTGISISDQNVISASGGSDNNWIECDNTSKATRYADMNTYKAEYEFMLEGNNKKYIFEVPDSVTVSDSSFRTLCFIRLGSYNYDGCIPLTGVSSNTNVGEFVLTTATSTYFDSGTPVLYDMNGNLITSTNIGDYIDSTNNVCLKPYICEIAYSGILSGVASGIVTPSNRRLSFYGTDNSNFGYMEIDNKKLYEAFINSTAYSYTKAKVITAKAINGLSDLTQLTLYRRKKSVIPVTP